MLDLLVDDVSEILTIEKLSAENLNDSFSVLNEFEEYKTFLYNDALNYQEMFISKTYLLIEKSTRSIIAYISLAADTVALNPREKKKFGMDDIPFMFLPALKITKLAVACGYEEQYAHVGSFLIEFACDKAFSVNNDFFSCRIVSVDADVEHNPNVIEFYKKNGFQPMKSNIYKRKFPSRTKIVGMWRDML